MYLCLVWGYASTRASCERGTHVPQEVYYTCGTMRATSASVNDKIVRRENNLIETSMENADNRCKTICFKENENVKEKIHDSCGV